MDASARFLLGGIGALAPVVLFLINLDFEQYVAEATAWKTIGYIVRTILLFLLGGFIAYLHEKENKRITLFLVGVSAPSLLAGSISTASPNASSASPKAVGQKTVSMLSLIPGANAQAQQSTNESDFKHFTLPPQSNSAEFFQGLFGTSPKNGWFVIASSHLDPTDAKKQADLINSKSKNYHADVYAPYGDNPYYAVVLGANLTQAQAKRLRDQAVTDGFPRDSYYKTFPNLPRAP